MFKRHSQRQSSSTKSARKAAPKIRLQALEPRVLLDAAAAATVEAMADQGHAPVDAQPDASNAELMQALAHANTHMAPVDARDAHAGDAAAPAANVFFIDRSLSDVDALVKDLGPNAEIHFIGPGQDGVKVIADTLQGRTDIGAIHLVSHGGEGELHLGTATLTSGSMQGEYRDLLAAIGHSLSADGDILIYGCDFAEGTVGQHASELLASLTGADVAASIDPTGAESRGGNWTLESRTGAIEARSIEARDWDHLMVAPTLTLDANGSSGGTGGNYRITSGPGGTEPTHLADVDALVSDADNDIQSLTLSLGGFANGAKESITFGSGNAMQFVRMDGVAHDPMKVTVGGTQFEINYNGSSITVSRSGGGNISAAELNGLLRTVGYLNDATTASVAVGNRTVGFTVSDGASTSAARFTTINVVAQQRFDDQGNAYVVIANTAPVVGSDGKTYAANRSSQMVTIAFGDAELHRSEWSAGINVNAMGFNTADGFAYGMNGNNLVRIGGDGSMVILGTIDATGAPASFSAGGFTSGDFGPDGMLYVYSNSYRTLQAINVQTMKWDHSVDFTVPTGGANIADIAYNAKDDKFYGVLPAASGGGLLSIDRSTGATRVIGATGVGPAVAFGGMFSDVSGNIYGFANSTGQVYQFDLNTGAGTALPNSSVGIVTGADGFSNRELSLINVAPVARDDGVYTVDSGSLVLDKLTQNDTDANGDLLRVSAINGVQIVRGTEQSIAVEHGTVLVARDGTLTFVPEAGYSGPATFGYTVDDGQGGRADAKVLLDIVAANVPPVAKDDVGVATEDTPLVVPKSAGLLANDTDADGNALSITGFSIAGITGTFAPGTAATIPGVGVLTINVDGSYSFEPAHDYNGPVPVATYTVSDGIASTTAKLSLSVTPVNDAPVARDDVLVTNEDTDLPINLIANDTDPEGDPLHIVSINGVAITGGYQVILVPYGQVHIDWDGTMKFVPNTDYSGPSAFDYVVADNSGAQTTGHVSVTVLPVNDAPVAHDDVAFTSSDKPVVINPLANDTDQESDPLHIVSINGVDLTPGIAQVIDVPHGKVEVAVDGTITFVPDAGYNGQAKFDYVVADPDGATDTGHVTVNVTRVNNAPVAQNDTVVTPEDTPIVLDLIGNDTDADGDALHLVSINGVAITPGTAQSITVPNGKVNVAADGTITFVPKADYNGPVAFDYVVGDAFGGKATGHVNVSVTPVNDAPVAKGDKLSTDEDTPLVMNLLGNDTDADGDALHLVSINGVAITPGTAQSIDVPNGKVNIAANGTVTFVPNPDYYGPVDFDYVVADPAGLTDTGHVNITVNPVSDPPMASDDNFTTNEDTSLVMDLLANDIDKDGDPLHLVSINGVAITPGTAQSIAVPNGTVNVAADGTLTFIPKADYTGPVDFDYVVADTSGDADTGHVHVAVAAVNDAPRAADDNLVTNEDTPLVLDLLGNDSEPDGEALHLVSINGVAITPGTAQSIDVPNGKVNIAANGTITFVPNANYNGPVDFDYVVADTSGLTDAGHVKVSVTPVNDPPVASDDNFSTNEDTSLVLNLIGNDTDADGDALHLVSINGVAITPGVAQSIAVPNGMVNIATDGTITFVPNANYNGPVSFDYVVADANGATDTGHVGIAVAAVNDAPHAADDNLVTNEDTPLALDLLGNDTDPDGEALHLVSINGVAITPGIAQSIDVPNGTVDIAGDGTITFVPKADYYGPVDFDYVVADAAGLTDTGHVKVTVNPVNDPPLASDDSFATNEDTPIVLDLLGNDNDRDGDPLHLVSINGVAITPGTAQSIAVPNGTVNVAVDGTLTFIPKADYNGPVDFNYIVADTSGAADTGHVHVAVAAVNDAPRAADDHLVTNEDTPLVLDLLGNDSEPDGEALHLVSINGVAISPGIAQSIDVPNGKVNIAIDGTITFVSNANYNGPVDFDYVVADTSGLTDIGHVTVAVQPVNDAPVASDDHLVTNEDTPLKLNLIGNDTDVDGDALHLVSINGVAITPGVAQSIAVPNGRIDIATDGTITFVPNADYNGPVDFDYVVGDAKGATDTGHVDIRVKPVNDAPVARDDNYSTDEDQPIELNLIGNDIDVDGDALHLVSINGVDITPGTAQVIDVPHGQILVSADGTVTLVPEADYNGTIDFDYVVADPTGASDMAHVRIAVPPVNDAPIVGNDSFTTPEDKPVTLDLLGNDRDVDGDALHLVSINGVDITPGVAQAIDVPHGTVNIAADGTITFVPDADYNGPVDFHYVVADPDGATGTGRVHVNVTPVNDAPVAGDDHLVTNEDALLTLNLLGNDADADGDVLHLVSINGVAITPGIAQSIDVPNGTVNVAADGTITFVPDADYNGPVAFDYVVADPSGVTDTGHVSIDVVPVNDAPVAAPDTFTTAEDKPLVLDLLGNDSDADGDVLHLVSINGVAITPGTAQQIGVPNGTVHVAIDGSITFVPKADYNGPVDFAYVVADTSGATGTGHVRVDVTAVNDAPVAHDDGPIATQPGTSVSGNVLTGPGADFDADGDPLCVTQFSVDIDGDGVPDTFSVPPGGSATAQLTNAAGETIGQITIGADGSFTFTPAPGYDGPVPDVTYTVSDGIASDSATLRFQDVPKPPLKGDGTGDLGKVDGPDAVEPPAGLVPPAGPTLPAGLVPPATEMPWRGDDVFVLRPSDSSFGQGTAGASRFATGTSQVAADARVLGAVNGLDSLNGTPVLDGEGAVLKAVNGVASLHGSGLAGELVVSQVSQDNAFGDRLSHSALRDHDGFDTEVRSIASLRVQGEVRLEVSSRGPQTWVLVEDHAPAGRAGISQVSATMADGRALPSWIRLDGHSYIAIDRPVGEDLIALRITVERSNGETRSHTIEIDNNAGEMREIGHGTLDKAAGKDKAAGDKASTKAGAKSASLGFSAQLAQASRQAAPPTVDAELMQALG
ncbi:Ig-like domain-containing protein [Variovorax robiniae]|uniref:Ig-like domain-containing protein n=1 Tax=Variovorax robiniae TaxID=1836199 RepID=A0ABU8X8D5_9BURK